MIIGMITGIIFDMLKKNDDKEFCEKLKKEIKKFSENNNIHTSLLYEYNMFCKNKFDFF
jgi:hypothetical protein